MIHIEHTLPEDPLLSEVCVHVRRHLFEVVEARSKNSIPAIATLLGLSGKEATDTQLRPALKSKDPIAAAAEISVPRRVRANGIVHLAFGAEFIAQCHDWLRRRIREEKAFNTIIADDLATLLVMSNAMDFATAKTIHPTSGTHLIPILIEGETGTGKEVVAKALHESSERRDKAFVAINCAAIPESLIESELFGYAAGAFTGGRSKGMKGLIAQADGGTLFLDEIGDMPLHLQTRLLRVLAEKEVTPLGSDKAQAIRLTVVAASHRDLRKLIAEGLFREDLYYRLCGAILYLPPLRQRRDKVYLIERLAAEEAAEMGGSVDIDPQAMSVLCAHPWPGNVRQLRNVLRFSLAVSDAGIIRIDDLPGELMEPAELAQVPAQARPALAETSSEADRLRWRDQEGLWLEESLKRHKWCVTAAAEELGLCRATIYRRMKRYGIVPPNLM